MSRFIAALTALFVANVAIADDYWPFDVEPIAQFERPWALAFLPDGDLLVTEKAGKLFRVTQSGQKSAPIAGIPELEFRGQGGFGDVTLHPDFANNQTIYISYVEGGDSDTRGAAVARAILDADRDGGSLRDVTVVWRQYPKVDDDGHYGHRIAFSDDGYLFISNGDRQKFDPSQDMSGNIGKIVRLHDDGSVPDDNPFYDKGGVTAQIWSSGHRNPLGMAFDANGELWDVEMGPKGGDELNHVIAGKNYGYPIVSNGDHYNDDIILNHNLRPEFEAPKVWWTPVISPGDLLLYTGDQFPEWQNNFLIAGLSSRSIIRIELGEDRAREVERFPMGNRIRGLAQGPEGAIWAIEDGTEGRLLKLSAN